MKQSEMSMNLGIVCLVRMVQSKRLMKCSSAYPHNHSGGRLVARRNRVALLTAATIATIVVLAFCLLSIWNSSGLRNASSLTWGVNEADSLRCVRCRLPMSEDKAIQIQKAAVESFQSLLSDPETLKASFESLLSDPDVLSLLASAVADSLVQEREKRASSIAETSDRRPS